MAKNIGKRLFLVITIVVCMLIMLTGCKNRVKPDKALSKKNNRYITIINGTESTINMVLVYAGKDEDIEIEDARQENVDEHSFAVKIPKAYKEKSDFTITFYDVYGLKYSRTIEKVPKKGNTEVKITKDDYVKRDGDWKRLLDKKMNE